MPLPGDDPISHWAKPEFDQATDTMIRKCQADVDDLQAIADQLRAAATDYGKTEAQITQAFDPRRYQPARSATDPSSSTWPTIQPGPTTTPPHSLTGLFPGGGR